MMKIGFFLARHLPMPHLRRIAWQERLTKSAYKNLIKRAQANPDPNDQHHGQIPALLNEQYTDLRMLEEEAEDVRSIRLIALARKLDVPIPPRYDDPSNLSQAWQEGTYMYQFALSDMGRARLKEAIRHEQKARHEDRSRWLVWVTPFIGGIGALTGLVAVLTRK